MEALKAAQAREEEAARESHPAADKTGITECTEAETTYTAANVTTMTTVSAQASTKPGAVAKKKGAKVKMTAKEKKERSVNLVIPPCVHSRLNNCCRSR